jgi:hypothetical protein
MLFFFIFFDANVTIGRQRHAGVGDGDDDGEYDGGDDDDEDNTDFIFLDLSFLSSSESQGQYSWTSDAEFEIIVGEGDTVGNVCVLDGRFRTMGCEAPILDAKSGFDIVDVGVTPGLESDTGEETIGRGRETGLETG